MVKRFCDRCGKETKEIKYVLFNGIEQRTGYYLTTSSYSNYTSALSKCANVPDFELGLCENCYDKVQKFAKSVPAEPERSIEVPVPGRDMTTTNLAVCCDGCLHVDRDFIHGDYLCDWTGKSCPEEGSECPLADYGEETT